MLPQVDTELPGLAGEDEPAFVYINYNDHGFAKCLLDERSEAFVRAHLNEFEDDLLRQLLWASFYVMVRDCKLKSTNYVDLVRTFLIFLQGTINLLCITTKVEDADQRSICQNYLNLLILSVGLEPTGQRK